uniref:Uncharacterized protein n=1 Tax=Globodera pallida TaxID=36090 RepID=A0A183BUY5_GLOPA
MIKKFSSDRPWLCNCTFGKKGESVDMGPPDLRSSITKAPPGAEKHHHHHQTLAQHKKWRRFCADHICWPPQLNCLNLKQRQKQMGG